jgi:hypothetical protein
MVDRKSAYEVVPEGDGSVTIAYRALDLVANGPTEASAVAGLINQVRVYAEEYFDDIGLYTRDPQRLSHLPLLLASTSYQRDEEPARFLGLYSSDATREQKRRGEPSARTALEDRWEGNYAIVASPDKPVDCYPPFLVP